MSQAGNVFVYGMLNITPTVMIPTMLQNLMGYPDSMIGMLLASRGAPRVACSTSPCAARGNAMMAALAAFGACCAERRRAEWFAAVEYKRNGGRPRHPDCCCSAVGLALMLHRTAAKRVRDAACASDASESDGDASRTPSPCAVRTAPYKRRCDSTRTEVTEIRFG